MCELAWKLDYLLFIDKEQKLGFVFEKDHYIQTAVSGLILRLSREATLNLWW